MKRVFLSLVAIAALSFGSIQTADAGCCWRPRPARAAARVLGKAVHPLQHRRCCKCKCEKTCPVEAAPPTTDEGTKAGEAA